MHVNPAPYYVNVSELRKSPTKIINQAEGEIVAVFNHGEIISYLISPQMLEKLLDLQEDQEDLAQIKKMDLSDTVDVNLDDL